MVSELHRLGYQRLRIMPYEYPLAWRVQIAPASRFSKHNGAFMPGGGWVEGEEFACYSCVSGHQYFNWADARTDDARALAEKFLARFPQTVAEGQGRDWPYSGWLSELVGHLERTGHLPFVTAEWLSIAPYDLRGLPTYDLAAGVDSTKLDFPLPPPGPLRDKKAKFSGPWLSTMSPTG